MSEYIPTESIERRIYVLRGVKVMLDVDLSDLYAVDTRSLNQAVKRNASRFPEDFMFQLSEAEFDAVGLKSQNVIAKTRGGRRSPPYAFTEQGVAMLSSVLKSERAVQVNVAIMRTFVRMRETLASHEELARKLDELEARYDAQFRDVFDALRYLMIPPDDGPRRIGFQPGEGP